MRSAALDPKDETNAFALGLVEAGLPSGSRQHRRSKSGVNWPLVASLRVLPWGFASGKSARASQRYHP